MVLALLGASPNIFTDVTGCRTLFATHYHEVTDLARTRTGVVNLNVAVREWNDQVFPSKNPAGPSRSELRNTGCETGRFAPTVLHRAKDILNNLEKAELNAEGNPSLAAEHDQGVSYARTRRKDGIRAGLGQLDLL